MRASVSETHERRSRSAALGRLAVHSGIAFELPKDDESRKRSSRTRVGGEFVLFDGRWPMMSPEAVSQAFGSELRVGTGYSGKG
eukprot:5914918-Prymnesium_polylepis.1